jgi:tetratricopeptide (TPR) repeat protein
MKKEKTMQPNSFVMTLILGLFLGACSTSSYRIQSSPSEAEVTFIFANGSQKQAGKTPVMIPASEVNPNREAFKIELKKEGYVNESLFILDSPFAKTIETSVTLKTKEAAPGVKGLEESLDKIASAVADIQKDIQVKNYEFALTKLNHQIAEHPDVATFYSLSANVHYLEKRFDRALSLYKKALSLNPTHTDVQKMITKIESFSGGSR